MKHAGAHWPANAGGEHPNRETIYSMPGVRDGALLIVADSARWWYGEARARCPLVIWRGLPRVNRLPAHLGWDTKRVADEVTNLWSEQGHVGREWFLPLNELQFSKEAGEDWRGYTYMVSRLAPLRVQLESYFASLGQDVGLMFPAWVPQDDGDRLHEWAEEAKRWDAICVHCYGSAETMRSRYQSYRDAFPGKLLFVGEWNSNHEGHDERESLKMWAEVAAADPLFMGATYYIWETNNSGENDLSIWGNSGRLALFRDPPAASLPAPIPEPIPVPEVPTVPEPKTREEVISISNAVADEVGIPRVLLLACGIAESNLRWNARRPADPSQDADFWPDVSPGVWQQAVRWSQEYAAWCRDDAPGHNPADFPGSDVTTAVDVHYFDVEHAARVAAAQLKAKLQQAMAA